MVDKVGHIRNPLTVIAVFAAVAEVSGTIVLPFVSADNQANYIWFLMGFPCGLVATFFWTLHHKHHVLYAPSDWKNEDNFWKGKGSPTAQEIDAKEREEAQEVEEASQSKGEGNDAIVAAQNNQGENRATEILSFDEWRKKLRRVETMAIELISKELNISLERNVAFPITGKRRVIYDAALIESQRVTLVEVKYFKGSPRELALLERLMLETELFAYRLRQSSRELIMHLVLVTDANGEELANLKRRINQLFERYDVVVFVRLVNHDELMNPSH